MFFLRRFVLRYIIYVCTVTHRDVLPIYIYIYMRTCVDCLQVRTIYKDEEGQEMMDPEDILQAILNEGGS